MPKVGIGAQTPCPPFFNIIQTSSPDQRFALSEGARIARRRTWAPDLDAGLGLAIVAEIARAHGGSIEVGGTRGGGAKFSLHLPLC